jgi:predicted MFS family arabinose efflux permease
LWCNAISFFAVIVAVSLVKVPRRQGDRRPVFGALADGLRFAIAHPMMRRMLVLMVLTIGIASPFIAFVSQMATNVLHGDARATSVLVTAQGIGAVTAAFTLGSVTKKFGVNNVMFGGVALLCPALVIYGFAPHLWLAAIALMTIGLFYGYAFTSFASVTQQAAPDDMRGRVLAVNFMVLGILFPIGTLIQGQIADAIGLRWTTAGSGLVLGAGLAAMAPWQRRAAALVTS